MEAQAPTHSRRSLYLIWSAALLLAPSEAATLPQLHRRCSVSSCYGPTRKFPWCRRISCSKSHFFTDALDWWSASMSCKRNLLVTCHFRGELASRAKACGKEKSTIRRMLWVRELVTDLLFRRAAKCNTALHSAVEERTKSRASH